PCREQSDKTAQSGQKKNFSEKLPQQSGPTRAEDVTDCNLSAAGGRSGQQQIGDIRARDQQHESDGAKEDKQRGTNMTCERFLQRRQIHPAIRVALGVVLCESGGKRVNLRLSLLQGHFRL